MKKIYFLFLFALIASVSNLWAGTKTVTFDATTDKSASKSLTKEDVTISVGDGALGNGTDYRIYSGKTMTVSSKYAITKVVFTCTANGTAKYGPGCFKVTPDSYEYSQKVGTWTGSATSIAFNANTNQVRATQIEVTYEVELPKCAAPTFSLADGGYYRGEQTLKIESATAGSLIHYEIKRNGAQWGESSYYKGETPQTVTLSDQGVYTVTAYAYASDESMDDSATETITFTISDKCATPTFNLENNKTYTDEQTLIIYSATPNAVVNYDVKRNGDESYRRASDVDAHDPIKIPIGLTGKYTVTAKAYINDPLAPTAFEDSDEATLEFTITNICGVPTFSVDEGEYTEAKSIALTPGDGGARVMYKINDESFLPYTDPIELNENGTYKITAYTEATETLLKSDEVTKTYTINIPSYEPYILCTNPAWLTDGAKIIFASSTTNGSAVAMSKTQKANNRGEANVTIETLEDKSITEKDADVAVFTVGKSNGNLTFYTNDSVDETGNGVVGYLYAASSSSNNLKTQSSLDKNGEWTVTIASSGAATITAQGNNTRNLMKYNSSSNLFSCYKSGQNPIYIYLLGSTSSVSKVSAEDGVKVVAAEGGVEVVAAEAADVAVYTVAGQLVRAQRVAEGSTLVNVPAGFYVVRAAGTVAKVVVK